MRFGNLLPSALSLLPSGAKRRLALAAGGALRASGLAFTCNVCGGRCPYTSGVFYREAPSCPSCGSSVRLRAVVAALSRELFGTSLELREFPASKGVTGLGLSDWDGYGRRLGEVFRYTNTYFHQEPRLDIMDVPPQRRGTLDFLVSSDVFEHVPPPVSKAFANAASLLKPGGLLVLTVPFRAGVETVEHFPDLFRYELVGGGAGAVLRNETRDGRTEVFTGLRFHGGAGPVLEMRLFGGASLERELRAAGFGQVRTHWRPVLRHGVFFWHANSLPLTARRTLT